MKIVLSRLCVSVRSVCECTECVWGSRLCVSVQSVCEGPDCVWASGKCVSVQSVCEGPDCVWAYSVCVSVQRVCESLLWATEWILWVDGCPGSQVGLKCSVLIFITRIFTRLRWNLFFKWWLKQDPRTMLNFSSISGSVWHDPKVLKERNRSRLRLEHEVDSAEPQAAVSGLLVARHAAQSPPPKPQEEQGRVPGRT